MPGPASSGLCRWFCFIFTFFPSPRFLAQTSAQYELRESISISTNGNSITRTSTHSVMGKIKEPIKPKECCEIKHCSFYQNDIIKARVTKDTEVSLHA